MERKRRNQSSAEPGEHLSARAMALVSSGRRLAALCVRNTRWCAVSCGGLQMERKGETTWSSSSFRAFGSRSGGGRGWARRDLIDGSSCKDRCGVDHGAWHRATSHGKHGCGVNAHPGNRSFHGSSYHPKQSPDYYQTLGIQKTADAKEIKKAYYDLAKKYHPDANKDDTEGALTKFQDVQKAYEVLKDPSTKQMYDQVGHSGFESTGNGGGGGGGGNPFGSGNPFGGGPFGSGGGGTVDFEDLFGDFFGGGMGAGGGARDVQTTVRVTLSEVKNGTAKRVVIPETQTVDRRTGVRTTHAKRDVDVDLPAGVEDGQRLRVPGEGVSSTGNDGRQRKGSLYINVELAEDVRFARVGNDLVTRVDLSFTEAALGGTASAPTLDESGDVQVKVRPATQTGDQLRLRGRGLPELGARRVGDLFVKFRVVTPKNMSDRQKQLLVEFANEEVVKSLPKADGAKSEYSSKDTAESKETEDTA